MYVRHLLLIIENIIHCYRILTAELAEAVRADNHMKFGLYHSLFEWYNPMYVSDKNSEFSLNEFVEKKVRDLI